jgi:hypothetical protein
MKRRICSYDLAAVPDDRLWVRQFSRLLYDGAFREMSQAASLLLR